MLAIIGYIVVELISLAICAFYRAIGNKDRCDNDISVVYLDLVDDMSDLLSLDEDTPKLLFKMVDRKPNVVYLIPTITFWHKDCWVIEVGIVWLKWGKAVEVSRSYYNNRQTS
jgi:hypothetical protein